MISRATLRSIFATRFDPEIADSPLKLGDSSYVLRMQDIIKK